MNDIRTGLIRLASLWGSRAFGFPDTEPYKQITEKVPLILTGCVNFPTCPGAPGRDGMPGMRRHLVLVDIPGGLEWIIGDLGGGGGGGVL